MNQDAEFQTPYFPASQVREVPSAASILGGLCFGWITCYTLGQAHTACRPRHNLGCWKCRRMQLGLLRGYQEPEYRGRWRKAKPSIFQSSSCPWVPLICGESWVNLRLCSHPFNCQLFFKISQIEPFEMEAFVFRTSQSLGQSWMLNWGKICITQWHKKPNTKHLAEKKKHTRRKVVVLKMLRCFHTPSLKSPT